MTLTKYELISQKYLPDNKIDSQRNPSVLPTIRAACLEALVFLDGDEQRFMECLNTALEKHPSLGWHRVDDVNAVSASTYLRMLAYMMTKS